MASFAPLVVKVGSSSLVNAATGELRKPFMSALVEVLAERRAAGQAPLIVTSGAIALGVRKLGLSKRPGDVPTLQACAAIGQSLLMGAWTDLLDWHGMIAAQVLLTHDDFGERERYLNIRDSMRAMLKRGVTPVVNENDTVAVDEIKFGDNDTLAARVAALVDARAVVLVSDIDGLYDRHPTEPGAKRVDRLRQVTDEWLAVAGGAGSAVGSGGMRTKLLAARLAAQAGAATHIGTGTDAASLRRLVAGESGTVIEAAEQPVAARKRWIAAMKPAGVIVVDAGCAVALATSRSLLPSGVMEAQGDFGRGACVRVVDPGGRALGQGLCEYSAAEVRALKGLPAARIVEVLGYSAGDEIIHRDHFVPPE